MEPFLTTILTIGSAVSSIISKEAVITGITGNRADAIFCKCLEQITLRLKGSDSKANHDLQRAIRKAQIESTIGVCGVILEKNGQNPNNFLKSLWYKAKRTIIQENAEVFWINALSADLLKELSEISNYKYLPPSTQAETQIELLLRPHGEGVADRLAQLKEHLLETTLLEIRLRHPNPPVQFIDIMRNGWNEVNSECEAVEINWFNGFCSSFAYELKNNQVVANIFQSQLLANLTVRLEDSPIIPVTSNESVVKIYQDLGGIFSAKLERMEANLTAFQTENHQEYLAIKEQINRLLPIFSMISNVNNQLILIQEIYARESGEIKDLIKAGTNRNEEITVSVGKNTEDSIITALHSAQNTIIEAIEKKKLNSQTTPLKIAILYKRNINPDEELLKFLEKELTERGHQVFIDRHLKIGVEWAKEIESQIRASDVVMTLLSLSSIQSEMLAYEIQIAYEESQIQEGKPLLLPIRVNYDGKLPTSIACYLDHLQYALWKDTDDKSVLIENLLESIYLPPKTKSNVKLESIGGAVPIDSNFYITRTIDTRLEEAIVKKHSIVLIKGPRQVGKTSSLARGLKLARNRNTKVILTDFQQLNFSRLDTIDKFYLTLGHMIADQLDLNILPDEIWKDFRPPNLNFEHYLRREVLGKIPDSIVWGLDEVDILFSCSYGSEVFGFIRSLHNARALEPDSPWFRLTMVMAYATEAHLFISDLNQSPFNVGTKLTLEDFNFDQLKELNNRYGNPLKSNHELENFYTLVGGHPYLVRRGLHEMALQNLDINSFESICYKEDGPFGDHLRRFLVILAPNEKLSDSVKTVIARHSCPTDDAFHRLRSAGLLIGDSARDAKFRCRLYDVYLKRHLT